MKRGFLKARAKDPSVAVLIQQETVYQEIGLLAQRGIYEFHQDLYLLNRTDGDHQINKLLQLESRSVEVRDRVVQILHNYQSVPVLKDKEILTLIRGDEGFPEPTVIRSGNEEFNLFAAIDCTFIEPDGTLHILDFKTGKSEFDRRQACVYLLAAKYLYPGRSVVASFYNLESQVWSKRISATDVQLQALEMNLIQIARQHQKDLQRHKCEAALFEEIFPPHPGQQCGNCQFRSICDFAI